MVLHLGRHARGKHCQLESHVPTDLTTPHEPGSVRLEKERRPGLSHKGKGKESILCETRKKGKEGGRKNGGCRKEPNKVVRGGSPHPEEERTERAEELEPMIGRLWGEGHPVLFGRWAIPAESDRAVGDVGSAAPPRVTCDTSTCEAARRCVCFVSSRARTDDAMVCRRANGGRGRVPRTRSTPREGRTETRFYRWAEDPSCRTFPPTNDTTMCVVGRFGSTRSRPSERKRFMRHGRTPTFVVTTRLPGTFCCGVLPSIRVSPKDPLRSTGDRVRRCFRPPQFLAVVPRTSSVRLRTRTVVFHGFVRCASSSSSTSSDAFVLLRTTTFPFYPSG